eukprot:scaffold5223_cov104-Isochrysis_galbana.AAC.5
MRAASSLAALSNSRRSILGLNPCPAPHTPNPCSAAEASDAKAAYRAACRSCSRSSCCRAACARSSWSASATVAASSQGIASCCMPRARNARARHRLNRGDASASPPASSSTPASSSPVTCPLGETAETGPTPVLPASSSAVPGRHRIVSCASAFRPSAASASTRRRVSSGSNVLSATTVPLSTAAISARQSAGSCCSSRSNARLRRARRQVGRCRTQTSS